MKVKVYKRQDAPEYTLRPGIRTRAIRSSNAFVLCAEMDPGVKPRPHSHDFDQLIIFTKGHLRFKLGDEVHEVGEGSMLRIPPGTEHCVVEVMGDETAASVEVFSPPREDYLYMVEYQKEQFES